MYSIYFHSSFQANSNTHTFSPIGHASSLNEGRNASTPPPSLQGSHKQPQTTSQASQFGTPMGSNLTAAPSSVRLRPFFSFFLRITNDSFFSCLSFFDVGRSKNSPILIYFAFFSLSRPTPMVCQRSSRSPKKPQIGLD